MEIGVSYFFPFAGRVEQGQKYVVVSLTASGLFTSSIPLNKESIYECWSAKRRNISFVSFQVSANLP
jgi:hypothetical protein